MPRNSENFRIFLNFFQIKRFAFSFLGKIFEASFLVFAWRYSKIAKTFLWDYWIRIRLFHSMPIQSWILFHLLHMLKNLKNFGLLFTAVPVKNGISSPKFMRAPVFSCTHLLRPSNLPPPPHLGSYTRALLVSQDRRHLFVTLWVRVYIVVIIETQW